MKRYTGVVVLLFVLGTTAVALGGPAVVGNSLVLSGNDAGRPDGGVDQPDAQELLRAQGGVVYVEDIRITSATGRIRGAYPGGYSPVEARAGDCPTCVGTLGPSAYLTGGAAANGTGGTAVVRGGTGVSGGSVWIFAGQPTGGDAGDVQIGVLNPGGITIGAASSKTAFNGSLVLPDCPDAGLGTACSNNGAICKVGAGGVRACNGTTWSGL